MSFKLTEEQKQYLNEILDKMESEPVSEFTKLALEILKNCEKIYRGKDYNLNDIYKLIGKPNNDGETK